MNRRLLGMVFFATIAICPGVAGEIGGTYTECLPPAVDVDVEPDPAECSNVYRFSGTCEGPGGAAGTYEVRGLWDGRTGVAREIITFTDIPLAMESGRRVYTERKNLVMIALSSCPDDPWANRIDCGTPTVEWTDQHKNGQRIGAPKRLLIKAPYPLSAHQIGIGQAAIRKLLESSTPAPRIEAPYENEKIPEEGGVFVVVRAALPCGHPLSAEGIVLELQRGANLGGSPSYTWVDVSSEAVTVANNSAMKRYDIGSGAWRLRARIDSPIQGEWTEWRQFKKEGTPKTASMSEQPPGEGARAAGLALPEPAKRTTRLAAGRTEAKPRDPGRLRAAVGMLGKTFENPTYEGRRVDLCLHWGRDCGEPAATAYCQRMSYKKATRWEVAEDIGAETPTWVLGDGKLCEHSSCDGFSSITCAN